jgi:hypothetical protein
VVEDGRDHLGAHRAGAPLDDSVSRLRRCHTEARYRRFDNNSVNIEITINYGLPAKIESFQDLRTDLLDGLPKSGQIEDSLTPVRCNAFRFAVERAAR